MKTALELLIATTIISVLYFALMYYESTQEGNIIKYAIVTTASLAYMAWMIAVIVFANEITKEEDREWSNK